MKEKPRKEKRKGKPGTRGPEGFISGILPVQEEIRAYIAIFIQVITVGLDFLKDEAERIGQRYQAERGGMPLGNRLRFNDAFLDYRKTRREMTRKLGHLVAYKRAMDALHDLVDIESDPARLRRLHEMKVELMMNVLRILVDIMRDLNKMSDDLKRAENNLSF